MCGLGGRWGEGNVGGVGEGETVIRIMYEKNLNDFINWKERKFHPIFCPSSLQGHLLCLLIDSHYSICSDHIISLISKNRKQNSVPLSPAATITFIFLIAQWSWIWLVLHQSLGNILKKFIRSRYKNHSELRFRIQHLWRHSTWDTLLSYFLSSYQELLPCSILNFSPFSKKDYKSVHN